jgi:hypothetical protein
MLKIEQAKAAAGQDANFGVQAFDKATGQATLEEIQDALPMGLQGLPEGLEAGDMLLLDQEHPGFQVFGRGSSALNGRWFGAIPQEVSHRPNMVGQMSGHSGREALEGGMHTTEVIDAA